MKHFALCLDGPAREAAGRCIIPAIGATTARALRDEGFEVNVVPRLPEARELVAELSAYVASQESERENG